jgi:predicted nucleotidyltransferase
MARTSEHLELARAIAASFSVFPQVTAIALSGSLTGQATDTESDIDLYVYTTDLILLPDRSALVAERGATRADLDLQFWDLGDEWIDRQTGIEVDVMYWDTDWIESMLDRVLVEHQASIGYSTSHWHTIRRSTSLYDPQGWFQALQKRASVPYPEPLRQAVIAKNHPLLRNVIPAYQHQIEKAVRRGDQVSVNHRVAALLASYFDVLFALNRLPNPGEKRLVEQAGRLCRRLAPGMPAQVERVLRAASGDSRDLVTRIDALIDGLDKLMIEEGFDPRTSTPG